MDAIDAAARRLPLLRVAGLARQLRIDSIRATAAAHSAHPTSSLSAADLIAVLAARHFVFGTDRPDAPAGRYGRGYGPLVHQKGRRTERHEALTAADPTPTT